MKTRNQKINWLEDWFIGNIENLFWIDNDLELGFLSTSLLDTFEKELNCLTDESLDLLYKDKGGEDE